jgi:AcrR family transcriptional regulator
MVSTMPKVIPEYKEAAKAKIIDAARTIFGKKGYHDATMDDVAKEVGVSKGALYAYFRSKEDLLKEISLQGHQTLRTILEETSKSHSLEASLEQIYATITSRYKGNLHTHFEIIAIASHDPKIRKIIGEDYQKTTESVEAFVKEKMQHGSMRTDVDARTQAELFTALYIGTMAKLVIGFPDKEVHDYWIRSMILLLGKKQG